MVGATTKPGTTPPTNPSPPDAPYRPISDTTDPLGTAGAASPTEQKSGAGRSCDPTSRALAGTDGWLCHPLAVAAEFLHRPLGRRNLSIDVILAYFGATKEGWSPLRRPTHEGPSLAQMQCTFPVLHQTGDNFDLDGTQIPAVGAIPTQGTAGPVLYALDGTNEQAHIIGTRRGLAPFLEFLLFVAGTPRDLHQKSARQLFESRQPLKLSGAESHLKIEPLGAKRFGLNEDDKFMQILLTMTGSESVRGLVANYVCPPVLDAGLVAKYTHRRAAHLTAERTFESRGVGIFCEVPDPSTGSWRRFLVMPHQDLVDSLTRIRSPYLGHATRADAPAHDPRLGDLRLLGPNSHGVKIHWEGGLMGRSCPDGAPTRFSIVSMIVREKAYAYRLDRAVSMLLDALVPSEENRT
jgi:hypothetical protein